MKGQGILNLVLVILLSLFATSSPAYQFENTFELTNFRMDGIAVIQGSGYSTSAEIGWAPRYILSEDWSVGIYPAFTLLRDSASSAMIAVKADGLIGYEPNVNWRFETGPGWRYWFSGTRLSAIAYSVFAVWKFLHEPFLAIDRLFFGYSAVSASPIAHEIRFGVQFTL